MVLEKGIVRYNNKQMEDAPYTTIKTGKYLDLRDDGYVVEINGVQYSKLMILNGESLVENDIVQLLVPNNQMNNMFILGKINMARKGELIAEGITSSNLGTVTTHIAMSRIGSGIARYKLSANCGTWADSTNYTLGTLPLIYRPSVTVEKRIVIYQASETSYRFAKLTITEDGDIVVNLPSGLTNQPILIDETYLL